MAMEILLDAHVKRWISRRWMALALCMLLVTATIVRHADGFGDLDDDDDENDDDEDEFDFMSTKLERSPPASRDECVVGATGDSTCAAATDTEVTSVVTRGLVTTKPKIRDILKEHSRTADPELRAFTGETLGYVTPWNGAGYDVAKTFRAKFSYIAPVWFQIREDPKSRTPILTGTHDIDRDWIAAVRRPVASGDAPKIVPRVVYERNKLASDDIPVLIEILLRVTQDEGFDGLVFEIPIIAGTMELLVRTGEAFTEAGKLLLLVLTRSSNEGQLPVTHEMMEQLLPVVHRFTMNAYDFQTPGPNAPMPWIAATIDHFTEAEKEKILMGIPFYGYDNRDAVTGSSYIKSLQHDDVSSIRWDASAQECFHHYTERGSRHVVYYPCLQFIANRLRLFQDSGLAGAAIWEIGQGLDYFLDLF
ncbi:hypothetical protein PINS_up007940 [Pythium insidiosum]|nr:hypothetical protein PINS_up007940 [Pythium insidiosum]